MCGWNESLFMKGYWGRNRFCGGEWWDMNFEMYFKILKGDGNVVCKFCEGLEVKV